nr:reverse transcriptase domain-containing protein [Tanacetum cinerariifolium]
MACSLPHTFDEIQALVTKLIDEDIIRQKALVELAVQFENASATKSDVRKAYEKCYDITHESRALIDTFLKQESNKYYEMDLALYRKAAKIEKQIEKNGSLMMTYSMDRPDPHTILGLIAKLGHGLRVRPFGVTGSDNHYDNLELPNMSPMSCAESHGNPKGYPTFKKKAINISSGITLRRMSAMANTTPIVTTVMKPTTNPRDADAIRMVNIQDFCEEHYEDILSIIMDKVRRDKRKEVLARLKVRDRLRYNDRHVLDRLGHRRQSVFNRLSETYSPSTTKSRPGRISSRDHSHGRSRPHRLDASSEDRPENRERFRGVEESYDNSHSSYGTRSNHGYRYHDRDRSRHMKRGMDCESPLSNVRKVTPVMEGTGRAARVWFAELPPESINSYKNLKAAILAYFMQQKKYDKDPVEIHNIKQNDGETVEDFMKRFKVETGRIKGAPECMRISEFMHEEKPPPLAKRKVTHHEEHMTNQSGKLQKKGPTSESKVRKKETPAKDKHAAIYMIQSWQRMTRQKVTQSFKRVREITFPPISTSGGTKGPLVIEVEIGGHMIHRMYVDGGSSMEILYEHCFNRLRPEVKNQMVPATTSLFGFSGETIWPLGQLRLLVTIGDVDHPTRAWMNFMIVRSLSPYNGIIERPVIKEIQAVPSITHRMLKFPADGGIVTIHSTILIPVECATVITSYEVPKEAGVRHENFKVALHPNFPDQEVAIRGQKEKGPGPITRQGHSSRGAKVSRGRDHQRGLLPRLVVQSNHGKKARRQLANLAESDEEKMTFHTGQGLYCYTKMPFGLKNAGATYQRLVDKAFDSQIGRNIEVYVDDLVIKSHTKAEMLRDIGQTFPKQAFKQLKQYLSELPLLVAPKPRKELIVYLSTSYGAISAVLMTERGMIQTPIYFVSRALQGPKLNYTPMEKLVLSLVFAAKRLRKYFQAHPITVITDQPIKQIMSRPGVAGRLQKWSVMLGEHNITYRPRTSVKGQVLADFLVEMLDESPPDSSVVEAQQEPWTLFTDGSSCVDGSGAGLILTSPEGTEFTYALRFQFAASNNEVEYEALIAGLWIAARMGVKNVYVLVEILKEKSIQEKEVTTVIDEDGPMWMTPIMEYLKEGTIPSDRKE